MFIDEKTMIFEIDIYTKSGIAKPDTLIILDQNNENNRVTFWLEQINKIIKKQNNRYDFKIALRYYQDIITAIDNNIKEKKNKYLIFLINNFIKALLKITTLKINNY